MSNAIDLTHRATNPSVESLVSAMSYFLSTGGTSAAILSIAFATPMMVLASLAVGVGFFVVGEAIKPFFVYRFLRKSFSMGRKEAFSISRKFIAKKGSITSFPIVDDKGETSYLRVEAGNLSLTSNLPSNQQDKALKLWKETMEACVQSYDLNKIKQQRVLEAREMMRQNRIRKEVEQNRLRKERQAERRLVEEKSHDVYGDIVEHFKDLSASVSVAKNVTFKDRRTLEQLYADINAAEKTLAFKARYDTHGKWNLDDTSSSGPMTSMAKEIMTPKYQQSISFMEDLLARDRKLRDEFFDAGLVKQVNDNVAEAIMSMKKGSTAS